MVINTSHLPEILPPGSEAAVKQGCICPRQDNAHGQGMVIDGEVAYWMSADCPLHGWSDWAEAVEEEEDKP